MHVTKCFDLLIADLERREDIKRTYRETVLNRLRYFRVQTLLDFDRRASPETIKLAWRETAQLLRPTNILEPRLRDRLFASTLGEFVGEGVTGAEPSAKRVPTPQSDSFDRWELFELFEDLHRSLGGLRNTGQEGRVVELGLNHLCAEAKLPRARRNERAIKATWLAIKPILERHGAFEKYRGAHRLRSSLKLFLFGTL